jgi:hypothetical protein
MALSKNKRGVEALPLRYIIIALVAALVIGIVLQFVGILKGGTIGAANQFNASVSSQTKCELDNTGPTVNSGTLFNSTGGTTINRTKGDLMYFSSNATDNPGGCGIDDYTGVFAYIYVGSVSTNTSVSLVRQSGDIFTATYNSSSFSAGTYSARIYAVDNSTSANVQRLVNQTNTVTLVN